MTLELNMHLPDAALIDRADAEFAATLEPTGAIWLQGNAAHFATDPQTGALHRWRARTGGAQAEPVEPNAGFGKVGQLHGHAGLHCRMETNCGFVLERATEDAARFSMAVIYVPPDQGDARTLLTLNTGVEPTAKRKGSYLFISDSDGHILAKDTGERLSVRMKAPAADKQPRLLLLMLDRGRLAVSALASDMRARVAEMEGLPAALNGPASLFIGCRSQRRGLKKTLGGALIRDVIFWPRSLLLAPRTPQEEAQRRALYRYFIWTS